MNKTEFINVVSERTGESKATTKKIVDSVIDEITEQLKNGNEVQFVGFGTFKVTERSARDGINPSTGQKISIPASKNPQFKSGKALKNAVNGK